ncbi:MAG: tail-specific protease, partial [Enterobacterales bacterium]|nr:tail-specific protease [Enterobacterales bacterium]
MNKFFRVSAIALALFAGASFAADNVAYNINQLPQLRQEPQHATVSERVTSRFTRSHYRQFDLNDDFSKKIFARYLNMLDYNHNVLLAS